MKIENKDVYNYYNCIYNWYSIKGKLILESELASSIFTSQDNWSEKSKKGVWFNLEFVKHLPLPNDITDNLIDYVVTQIIYGKLEWAQHKKDENQKEMIWYAKQIENLKSVDANSFKNSELFSAFGIHHENIETYALDKIEYAKNN